ncbi:MAG: alpha/beta hydrolase [Ginsengibacter sp.]
MKKILLLILMFATIRGWCQQKAFKAEVYGKGQPIILIPGYACSGDVWNATVNSLKANYQLHVLTLAGFAGVPPIDSPILQTVKDDLIQYVKENHLDKPVLMGHNLGAFLCLWVASEEPSLFLKIICVDGVPFTSAITNPSTTAEQVKMNPSYDAEAIAGNFIKMPGTVFEENQFKRTRALVGDTAQARLLAGWAITSDRKTLGYTYVEMATTDLRKEIAKITIPVLVLGSTNGTRQASQKMLNDEYNLLPNKTIIIAPGKHFIMYDNPLWFREQVKNFLINDLKN